MTLFVPESLPVGEGAYITFTLNSHITPLRVQIDTLLPGTSLCASQLAGQVVFGNLAMLQAPINVNGQSEVSFFWSTFAVVPSGNAVAEINQTLTRAGGTALSSGDGAYCRR